jgi:peroxiredoxin
MSPARAYDGKVTNLHEVDWSTLPRPSDDGAADHLTGMAVSNLPLPATDGTLVDLAALAGWTVLYAYPRTGRPGLALPHDWDAIPGARGCTPQSCAFRDHAGELRRLGVDRIYGLSTQPTDEQREAVERLRLPFALLSDSGLAFARAHRLPTFEVEGTTMLRRLTLILQDGRVRHTMYPVFPPDANAGEVGAWFAARSGCCSSEAGRP